MFTLIWVILFVINIMNVIYNIEKDNKILAAFVGAAAGFSLAMIMLSLNI